MKVTYECDTLQEAAELWDMLRQKHFRGDRPVPIDLFGTGQRYFLSTLGSEETSNASIGWPPKIVCHWERFVEVTAKPSRSEAAVEAVKP